MQTFIASVLCVILAQYQTLIDYAGPHAASQLVQATNRAQTEFQVQVDPRRLATLAKYESHFTDATGRAGERGMLQIHPCHRRSMAKLGLDFENEVDRLVYGCVLYAQSGDRPWAVRRLARRDYERWFR